MLLFLIQGQFSVLYWGVQVNNMEDLGLHGGATSLIVSLCPPHPSLPRHPPLPLPAVQKCLLILIDTSRLSELCHNCSQIAFSILSCPSFFSSKIILIWEVEMCWSVFVLSASVRLECSSGLGCFIWSLSVFYPQIPIISADHLSSHKYLTQM